MFTPLVRFLINHRKSTLVVLGLLTLFFISPDLPYRDVHPVPRPLPLQPSVRARCTSSIAKYFGGAYQATLMLEVKNGDVFNTETLAKMRRIQYAVDLIPGVDHFGIFSIASPEGERW